MPANVAVWERWASIASGAGLLWFGVRARDRRHTIARAVGASLIVRGATGHCPAYHLAHIDTTHTDTRRALGGARGIKVAEAVTVNRPVSEVYAFWRRLENLPRVMDHVESISTSPPNRSHWLVRGPAGTSISWDAETINDVENTLIAWRSLDRADVVSAGSVNFREAPAGRGTEVRVVLQYAPPAGKVGAAIAWLFGESAAHQIREDLRRVKQYLETSEVMEV